MVSTLYILDYTISFRLVFAYLSINRVNRLDVRCALEYKIDLLTISRSF